MLEETGCDAIMIGRGVLGNPWLVKEVVEYIENGNIVPKPTPKERVDMCLKHISYLREIKCDKLVVLESRNHIAWYLKGLTDSNEIKNKIFLTKDVDDIITILNDYKERID